jgi:hypothetical protein
VIDVSFVELEEEPVIASLAAVVVLDANVVDGISVDVIFDSRRHSKSYFTTCQKFSCFLCFEI